MVSILKLAEHTLQAAAQHQDYFETRLHPHSWLKCYIASADRLFHTTAYAVLR